MKSKTVFLRLGFILLIIFSCNKPKGGKENEQKSTELTTQTWVSEKNRSTEETDEEKRFYELTKNLQQKFEAGEIEEVKSDINEIKRILPNYATNWNYGNAVHKINVVEGRIALKKGNVEEAKRYLISAGKTKGSPQLNSFGPNMSLAKELLEKREREIVIQYFDLCSKFWKSDYSKLNDWKEIVQKGEIPEFGANLKF
jgi:hypothetical protein